MKIFDSKRFLGFLFLAMGLAWLVIPLVAWSIIGLDGFDEVPARITEITVSQSVYVEYTYQNEHYTARSNVYNSNMRVGDELRVYVDPDDPQNIYAQGTNIIFIVFASLGTAFLAAAAILLALTARRKRKKEELLAHGERAEATIMEVARAPLVKINGRSPYQIICCVSDSSGYATRYKTGYLTRDPSAALAGRQTLPVYLDPDDKENYYIALEEI